MTDKSKEQELTSSNTTKETSSVNSLGSLKLGKAVEYRDNYDKCLLQAVPRQLNRTEIGLTGELPFAGEDVWTGYEVSWLNPKGKPVIAILKCIVPADSINLIESKSFKLYLNSFNQTHFASLEQVENTMKADLSECAGKAVSVELYSLQQFDQFSVGELEGTVIDDIDIEIHNYTLNPEHLKTEDEETSEILVSHLLKSNCLITNQPDWGSVAVKYQGSRINKAGLLKYLISFRQHNEFHEQCVERIFCDIMSRCKPNKLSVLARYTRRGGLDINPFRSNYEMHHDEIRLARQ